MDHENFMKRCLELALEAKRKGKTAVGSILVKDNQIISEGVEGNSMLPSALAHAEIIAIVKAMETQGTHNLSGLTLYSTVEPCIMCAYMIRETKINHIIFGTSAGEIGGALSDYPLLTFQKISRWLSVPKVTPGILELECKSLLKKD